MPSLHDICSYLDTLLSTHETDDASNNGLQVEASKTIKTIAFGVDCSQRTIRLAIEANADLLFVHHGMSWGNGIRYFIGEPGEKLQMMFRRELSLYACHLPLDMHPVLGNNAVLADFFDLVDRAPAMEYHHVLIGQAGTLKQPMTLQAIANRLADKLSIDAGGIRIYPGNPSRIARRLCFVSGAGGSSVQSCRAMGIDTLITGELAHQDAICAEDYGISVIAAGHYATETTGPKAVMKHIAAHFPDIKCLFIDAPTGF